MGAESGVGSFGAVVVDLEVAGTVVDEGATVLMVVGLDVDVEADVVVADEFDVVDDRFVVGDVVERVVVVGEAPVVETRPVVTLPVVATRRVVDRRVDGSEVVAVVDRREVDDRRWSSASVLETVVGSTAVTRVVAWPESPAVGPPSVELSSPPSPPSAMGSKSIESWSLPVSSVFVPDEAVERLPLLRVKSLAFELVDELAAGWDMTPESSSSADSPRRWLDRAPADVAISSAASFTAGPAGFSSSVTGAPLSTGVDSGTMGPRWIATTTSTISTMAATRPQSRSGCVMDRHRSPSPASHAGAAPSN